MKKFIVVSGGCRNLIDDVEFVDAISLLALTNQLAQNAYADVADAYYDESPEGEGASIDEKIEMHIEEFNVGGSIFALDNAFEKAGVVVYGEELWCMIVEVSKENAEELQAFAEDEARPYMFDFETLINLSFDEKDCLEKL